MKIEACVETLEDAQTAARNGADRVELCSNLSLDGLSPDLHLVRACQTKLDIPLAIMLRFKSDNFYHTQTDIEALLPYADNCIKLGIKHFVFGALTKTHGDIILDLESINSIARHIRPAILTVHKAIDLCTDIFAETQRLDSIENVEYILTSGTMQTAWEGRNILQQMTKLKGPKIIAAGKITSDNLPDHHAAIGSGWYHGKRIVPGIN